jgi:LexA-binding, inner membrane-associated putative hydrolase
VAAPFGHAFVGMAVARRLGVRSPSGLAAAALAGNLPDVDIPLGWLLHGDAWRMHRTWTHTAAFAVTCGSLAGLAGVVRSEAVEGERDPVADALTGAAVVASHLLLDRVPYLPDVRRGPSVAGLPLVNWLLDAVEWGVVAWLIWPKDSGSPRQVPAPIRS